MRTGAKEVAFESDPQCSTAERTFRFFKRIENTTDDVSFAKFTFSPSPLLHTEESAKMPFLTMKCDSQGNFKNYYVKRLPVNAPFEVAALNAKSLSLALPQGCFVLLVTTEPLPSHANQIAFEASALPFDRHNFVSFVRELVERAADGVARSHVAFFVECESQIVPQNIVCMFLGRWGGWLAAAAVCAAFLAMFLVHRHKKNLLKQAAHKFEK